MESHHLPSMGGCTPKRISCPNWWLNWLVRYLFGEGKASSKDKLSLTFQMLERSGRKLSLLRQFHFIKKQEFNSIMNN